MKLALTLSAALLFALLGAAVQAAASLPADFYNQGNAHARAQQWGLAVLDYRRAQLLAPDDRDLEANLRYALAAAKVTPAAPTFVQRLSRQTTPNIATGLGLLGLVILGCALLLSRPWARLGAVLLGTPMAAFAIGHALGLRPLLHSAVVVGGPASVQASPVPMADVLFLLPEATSVVISAERADYLLVTTDAGATGWVPRAHVVAVIPPKDD